MIAPDKWHLIGWISLESMIPLHQELAVCLLLFIMPPHDIAPRALPKTPRSSIKLMQRRRRQPPLNHHSLEKNISPYQALASC